MNIYCLVTPQGLVPIYDSDYEEKKRLKEGDRILCTIKKPRNYEFHKKFFALVRLCFDNLPETFYFEDTESLLEDMKVHLNMYDIVVINGYPHIKTRSIKFSKMDNLEFERFYNRAIDVILDYYLRDNNKQEILDEVIRFM